MEVSALTPVLVDKLFGLFKSGQTPEQAAKEAEPIIEGYKAELQHGNAYTKAARPTAIYLCILMMFNDFIARPYINAFGGLDRPMALTEQNFRLMILFLTALGLARSVMDKQGKWMEKIAERIFKK